MAKISFSFDDGNELDKKVIELIKKYGFKDVTFFVPINSWGFMNLQIYKDFKVGGHTYSHPADLKLLTDIQLDKEIIGAKNIMDACLGYVTNIFCYPRGRYDERVIEYVKKAGYKFARTTRIGFGNNNSYELKGFHLYNRKEYNGVDWLKYILNVIDKNSLRWIHIWGHSLELEKFNEFGKFELLLKTINENKLTQ